MFLLLLQQHNRSRQGAGPPTAKAEGPQQAQAQAAHGRRRACMLYIKLQLQIL
jgi:hypothetical protein